MKTKPLVEPNGIKKINRAALPMVALVIPIAFENFFRILVSSVDTVMLSGYSQQAVAGIGLVSQYIFLITILFNVICIGTTIVLAQYLGAERTQESAYVTQGSVIMITAVAIFISTMVFVFSKKLLGFYNVEEELRVYASQYLFIFGGIGAFFIAFNMLQATILRAYGYTKDAMYITMTANVINVIGNAISLYGPFGLPVLGVPGVAASSVISQFAACILLAIRINKKPDVKFPLRGWKNIPSSIYKTILKIGVPTAGENMSYNVSQIVIMAMVSTLGTFAMSSMIYTQTIARFVFILPMSIGAAVQLKTGYWVGSKQPEIAYKKLYKYQIIGTFISMTLMVILNLFKSPLIGVFSKNPEISTITFTLLLFSFYIEFGRSINLVTISALKGAGDVRFPVFFGIFSMWCIMVLGSYVFGIHLGFGLIGIWLSIGTDETFRGFAMLLRWRSKKWMTKAIK